MTDFDIDGPQASVRPPRTGKRLTVDGPSVEGSKAGLRLQRARGDMDPASLLTLQRTVGNAGVVQRLREGGAEKEAPEPASPVLGVIGKGGGSPLPDATRTAMEERLGQSFADVRVHTGGRAAASARSVASSAYTVGHEIVFADGQYDPGSGRGQRTLAHELAHVVQQRHGRVEGTDVGGGISVSHPSDRFERAAEATASRVASGAVAQRQTEGSNEEEEEERPAGAVAQRQAEMGEEGEEEEETPGA